MNQQSENSAILDGDSLIATAQRAARLTSVAPEPVFTREGDVETSSEVAIERKSSGLFLKKRWIEYETTSRFGKGDVPVLGPHWPLAREVYPIHCSPYDRWEKIEESIQEELFYALLPGGEIVEVRLAEYEITPKPGSGVRYRVIHDHKCRPLDSEGMALLDKGVLADIQDNLARLLEESSGSRRAPIAHEQIEGSSSVVEAPRVNPVIQGLGRVVAGLLTLLAFLLATYVTVFLTYVITTPQETDQTAVYYQAVQYEATLAVGSAMPTGLLFAAVVAIFGPFFCTLPWFSLLYAVLARVPVPFDLPYFLPAQGEFLHEPLNGLMIQATPIFELVAVIVLLSIPGVLVLTGLAQSAIPYRPVKRVVR